MQANSNAAAVDSADSAAAVSEQAQGLTAEQFLHLFIRWAPFLFVLVQVLWYADWESRFSYWKCGIARRLRVKVQFWCAPFRIIAMAEPEDSVPWEVRLLQSYCNTESDLDAVSMPMCRVWPRLIYEDLPVFIDVVVYTSVVQLFRGTTSLQLFYMFHTNLCFKVNGHLYMQSVT